MHGTDAQNTQLRLERHGRELIYVEKIRGLTLDLTRTLKLLRTV
jgi:hypothetical protein